jgi:putative transposase
LTVPITKLNKTKGTVIDSLSKIPEKYINLLFPKSKRGAKLKFLASGILAGLEFLCRTGCQWRAMPEKFPPWQVCYYHMRRLKEKNLWGGLLKILRRFVRSSDSREESTRAIVDSQSVRIGTVRGCRGFDGGKKVYGRKRHLLVDSMGHLIDCIVTPANAHDGKLGARLIFEAKIAIERGIKFLHADRGYRGIKMPNGVKLVIGESPQEDHFVPIALRWKVERSFAWLKGYRRLDKDREGLTSMSEAFIKLA